MLQIMFLVFACGLLVLVIIGLGICVLRGTRQLSSLTRRSSARTVDDSKLTSDSKESCPSLFSPPPTPNVYMLPTPPASVMLRACPPQSLSPSLKSLLDTQSQQSAYPPVQSIALGNGEVSASSCSSVPSCSLYACTTSTTIPHSSMTSVPSTVTTFSRGRLDSDLNESFEVVHAQSHVIRISRATFITSISPDSNPQTATIQVPGRTLTSGHSGRLLPDDEHRSQGDGLNVIASSSTVTIDLDEFPVPPAPA